MKTLFFFSLFSLVSFSSYGAWTNLKERSSDSSSKGNSNSANTLMCKSLLGGYQKTHGNPVSHSFNEVVALPPKGPSGIIKQILPLLLGAEGI